MKRGYGWIEDGLETWLFTQPWLDGCGIYGLRVPPQQRGRGIAGTLLRQLMLDADRASTILYIGAGAPSEDNGLSLKALIAWYERCGFVYLRGSYSLWRRLPKNETTN